MAYMHEGYGNKEVWGGSYKEEEGSEKVAAVGVMLEEEKDKIIDNFKMASENNADAEFERTDMVELEII